MVARLEAARGRALPSPPSLRHTQQAPNEECSPRPAVLDAGFMMLSRAVREIVACTCI